MVVTFTSPASCRVRTWKQAVDTDIPIALAILVIDMDSAYSIRRMVKRSCEDSAWQTVMMSSVSFGSDSENRY